MSLWLQNHREAGVRANHQARENFVNYRRAAKGMGESGAYFVPMPILMGLVSTAAALPLARS
jgi:hypothetical protein